MEALMFEHLELYLDVMAEQWSKELEAMTEDEIKQELYTMSYTPESLAAVEIRLKATIDKGLKRLGAKKKAP